MSTLTKVFVVLTSVLAIALSCMFIAAAAQWDNWRLQADRLRSERDAAKTEAANTAAAMQVRLAIQEDQLNTVRGQLNDAQQQIDRLTQQLAGVQRDLARADNERLAAEAGRTKLQEILDVTTAQLKALQKQNQTLLAQTMDLQTRNSRLNSRVLELTTNVQLLTDESRNIQEKLFACERQNAKLQKLAAAAPASGEAPAVPGAVSANAPVEEIRGKIIDVQDGYAAINVGQSSGVVAGMTFMVYREGGTYLGELVIEKVSPDQAGGRLNAAAQGEIRAGDQVVYGIR